MAVKVYFDDDIKNAIAAAKEAGKALVPEPRVLDGWLDALEMFGRHFGVKADDPRPPTITLPKCN